MHSRSYDSETDVYEFPVTFEDEQWRLEDSLPQVLAVTDKIARHGGLVNLLIHTESTAGKLQFQKEFVAAMAGRAHFSTMNNFGDWWLARESVRLEQQSIGSNRRQLTISVNSSIDDLTLELPATWQYEQGLAGTRQSGNQLILGPLERSASLQFLIN